MVARSFLDFMRTASGAQVALYALCTALLLIAFMTAVSTMQDTREIAVSGSAYTLCFILLYGTIALSTA